MSMSEQSINKILRDWYEDDTVIGENEKVGYNSKENLLSIFKGPQKDLPKELVKYKKNIIKLNIEETELSNNSLEIINCLTELTELLIKSANFQDLNPIKNLEKLTTLTLSGMPFRELPNWQKMLDKLENLDISNTRLSELKLPPTVLGKIASLNISMTNITVLPLEILKNIKELNISMTNIRELPGDKDEDICNHLEKLNISQTQIGKIPDCYFSKTLETLDISQCGVSELSDALLNLENLTLLNIKGLKFKFMSLPGELPTSVFKLNKLKRMDLSHTNIERLPDWFDKLGNLEYLGLVGCSLLEITLNQAKHINIRELKYKDEIGDIINSPKGVYIKSLVLRNMDVRYLWQNDWGFLKSYYEENDLTPAHEVKLVFFGDKGVGKSTVINRIFGIEYATDFFADQIGLQVCIENPKLPLNTKGEKLAPNTRLKIWNMSGEPLYQSAHPIFMTDESLYIVVLDANKEDVLYQRALFWLHYIERRTPNSSVLLMLSHTGKKAKDHIFEEMLKVLLSGVPRVSLGSMANVEFEESLKVSVSGVKIEGVCLLDISVQNEYMEESSDMDSLIKTLTEAIIKMPVYTKRIPTSWKKIARHTELLIQVRTAISLKRFRNICKDKGVKDLTVQNKLLTWLGETGLVHEFGKLSKKEDSKEIESSSKMDTNIENDIIYSILWLTKGLYKSLIVANDKNGIVSESDLHEALNEDEMEDNLFYSSSDIKMLINEMERCGLAIRNEKICYFPIAKSILYSDDKTNNSVDKIKNRLKAIMENQRTCHYTMELPILTEDMLSAFVTQLAINHMKLMSNKTPNPYDIIAWGREGIALSYLESDALMVVGIPGCPSQGLLLR